MYVGLLYKLSVEPFGSEKYRLEINGLSDHSLFDWNMQHRKSILEHI